MLILGIAQTAGNFVACVPTFVISSIAKRNFWRKRRHTILQLGQASEELLTIFLKGEQQTQLFYKSSIRSGHWVSRMHFWINSFSWQNRHPVNDSIWLLHAQVTDSFKSYGNSFLELCTISHFSCKCAYSYFLLICILLGDHCQHFYFVDLHQNQFLLSEVTSAPKIFVT